MENQEKGSLNKPTVEEMMSFIEEGTKRDKTKMKAIAFFIQSLNKNKDKEYDQAIIEAVTTVYLKGFEEGSREKEKK